MRPPVKSVPSKNNSIESIEPYFGRFVKGNFGGGGCFFKDANCGLKNALDSRFHGNDERGAFLSNGKRSFVSLRITKYLELD
jgi:hypothetical protein